MKNTAKLCLGTVQFGKKYGINNISGQPNEKEIFHILDIALENGIEILDTASAYGNAEEIIGKYIISRPGINKKMKIISKLSLRNLESLINLESIIRHEIQVSLKNLHIQQLYGYLLHVPEHMYNEKIVEELQKIKKEGLIQNIGVSIYYINDGKQAVKKNIFDFIQLPYNILDQRGKNTGFLKLAKENGLTIFTRSVFLQGLLMMEYKNIPEYLKNAKPYLIDFENLLREYQLDKISVLLNYVIYNSNIDYVIVGIDNAKQLQESISKLGVKLPDSFLKKADQIFENVNEKVILPNLWGNDK